MLKQCDSKRHGLVLIRFARAVKRWQQCKVNQVLVTDCGALQRLGGSNIRRKRFSPRSSLYPADTLYYWVIPNIESTTHITWSRTKYKSFAQNVPERLSTTYSDIWSIRESMSSDRRLVKSRNKEAKPPDQKWCKTCDEGLQLESPS